MRWRRPVRAGATTRHVDGPPRWSRRTAIERVEFAVVDTETSSADPARARILQVAVVGCLGDGTVLDRWCSLVRPHDGHVGPTTVHGLAFEDVVDAPVLEDVVPDLLDRLRGRVLVAHNLPFDRAMLDAAFLRAAYRPPPAAQLDTLALSHGAGGRRGHGLAALCHRYGVPLVGAHDALADATATAAVLACLLRERGVHSLGDLVALAPEVDRPAAWPVPAYPAAVRARVSRERVAIPAMLRASGRRREAEDRADHLLRERDRARRVRFDRGADGTWSVLGPPDLVHPGPLAVETRRARRDVVVTAVEPAARVGGRPQVRGHLAPRQDG